MSSKQVQSFITSGSVMSFEREVDLAAPNAKEKIDRIAGDFRRLFANMRERAAEISETKNEEHAP
jgi:hypothetical protein